MHSSECVRSPALNNRGDVLFIGDVTDSPGIFTDLGLFLYRQGQTMAIARPHDAMPGGGNLVAASSRVTGYDIDESGGVVFFAILDTDDDQDGVNDTGLYSWKDGVLDVVLRTGTEIPNLGIVQRSPTPGTSGSRSTTAANWPPGSPLQVE